MTARVLYRGTQEYIEVELTSTANLTGTIEFSLDDRETWLTAEWVGDVGTTRTAEYLLTPETTPAASSTDVFVRFTDNPEIPLLNAGQISIR